MFDTKTILTKEEYAVVTAGVQEEDKKKVSV
jgi:hypothetical protein